MNEFAYVFRVLAVLKIIEDSSSRLFRSRPESIRIYLAPGYKETCQQQHLIDRPSPLALYLHYPYTGNYIYQQPIQSPANLTKI